MVQMPVELLQGSWKMVLLVLKQTQLVGSQKGTFERLNNQYATSGGTLSIADMTNLYISCQINSPNGRGPDLIICSQDYFATYKGLIQANNERYIDDQSLMLDVYP
jgi:hypothetical protein